MGGTSQEALHVHTHPTHERLRSGGTPHLCPPSSSLCPLDGDHIVLHRITGGISQRAAVEAHFPVKERLEQLCQRTWAAA